MKSLRFLDKLEMTEINARYDKSEKWLLINKFFRGKRKEILSNRKNNQFWINRPSKERIWNRIILKTL